jgi:predicted aconitase with swiveling domain
MGMLAEYKLRSGDLFSDMDKVPQMLTKGKLALLPSGGGDASGARVIFKRAEEEEKSSQ